MSAKSPKTANDSFTSHSAYPQWDDCGTSDEVLAQAKKVAHGALLEITATHTIGEYVGVRLPKDTISDEVSGESAHGEENGSGVNNIMLTHLFKSAMRGYQGWQWFVTLSRSPDSEKVTVSELGLLPTPDSIIVPS